MLSKSIRPLHNPAINPDMYSRSTPTGIAAEAAASAAHPPPAIVQAAKNNAYYIGRLQQHLDDFDKDLTEWHDSGVWKQDYKTWGAACELALDMTRQAAHKAISRYKAKASAVSGQASTTVDVSTDSKDAKLLEKFSTREDPEAPLPGVVDANAPLENGETMEDYEDRPKLKTRTASTRAQVTPSAQGNGKSKYMNPVWKVFEDGVGKLIRLTDDMNRVLPDREEHRGMLADLKACLARVERWHRKAKS